MFTMFMDSKNSKNHDSHRLVLNVADGIDLSIVLKISLSNLSIYYT